MPRREAAGRRVGARRWAYRVGLAVLPLALAVVGYHRPALDGHPLPRLVGDGAFYVYQLTRACEVGGRWWEVAADPSLGAPYPPVTAKHPGIFEGVDLMLVSAVTGRFLAPTANYHALAILILAVNGWVAAGIAHRLTRSYGWAALAVVLITLNDPTAGRLGGHLHLFKLGWILLAVGAFAGYLEAPTWRRGLLLGLATAWVLASSFYLGFLMGVGLAAWWLGCLVAGRLGPAHVGATLAAGLGCAVAGAALTFPVWTNARGAVLSGQYFQRMRHETWLYGAELWQYFVPPDSAVAKGYIAGFTQKGLGAFWEGWYYPGHVVLLAVLAYAIARLRGRSLCANDPRFLDLAMGLISVFVVLSLAGGPVFVIYQWFPGFRCYGRAGIVALALGCATAPAVLQGMTLAIRNRRLRVAFVAGIVALAGFDASRACKRFYFAGPGPDPAWSAWLGKQPGDVRLAAIGPGDGDPFYWWGVVGFDQRLRHGHATLNGGEFALLYGDLTLVNASWDRPTPDSLRLIATFGYNALAFRRDYLDAQPWIADLPWLDRREEADDWSIFRVKPTTPRYPVVASGDLLAGLKAGPPRSVPPESWITGRLALGRDVVVMEPARIRVAWEDARGRRAGKSAPALFQHVFGPDLPAYTVLSPKEAGPHRLVFLDGQDRPLATLPFEVDPRLPRWRMEDAGPPESASSIEVDLGDEPVRVALVNDSRFYYQAHSYRDPSLGAASVQPGMTPPTPGSLILRAAPIAPPGGGVESLLPADLPPGGRVEMFLPMKIGVRGVPSRVRVTPYILAPGDSKVPVGVRVEILGPARAGVVTR